MSKTLQNSSWDLIYKKLDTLAPEKSFKEKSELADEMFEKALTPWHKPFENGLESYRSLIFISIKNDGDAIANDVYLNLPEPALLMIENEGQEYSSIGPTKEYKIASIRQEGTYRVWAWIKSEKNKFNEYSIKIGSENQLASMEHARSYSGFPARIAENSTLFGVLFTAMFFTMLATIYIFFTTAPEKPKEIKAG